MNGCALSLTSVIKQRIFSQVWIRTALFSLIFFKADLLVAQISPTTLPDLKLAGAGTVNAMVFQEDGKIIIGGEFNAINGVPRRNLARLNPNGSVDATWFPTTGDTVACLALSDTDVFVGLKRSQNYVNALLKISRTGNGQADTNWFPNPNGDVRGLALFGTNLYAAGFFQSIGGLSRTGLAKINITGTGSGDPTFTFNVGGLGGGVCEAMTLNGTNLYVGGRFQNIGGSVKTNLARIFLSASGTGTVDIAWIPNPAPARFSDPNEVTAITVSDTNVFVGGQFTKVGGQNRTNLAKLSTTGSGAADPSWTPGCPNSSSFISALAVSGTNLYVGGYITCFNGQSRTNIARLRTTGTGATDLSWTPIFDSNVQGITLNGSDVYVCGLFQLVNGTVSLGMAKLDSIVGKLDSSFHAQVQRPGIVYSAARQPDGKIVVGGSFWSAGDLPRQNIARVNVDGTLDTTWAPFVDSDIVEVTLNEYGIYIQGGFLNVNGISKKYIAKLFVNSDGVDTNWNPNPSQIISDIVLSGTNSFVCGDFFTIGGTNRSKLVKLNGNGIPDPQWVANPTGSVSRLLISGTNLYVAGTFNKIGGVNRTNLARLSTEGTGTVDTTWNPNTPLFVPGSLALDGTNLYIGGLYSNTTPNNFAIRRVSTAGSGPLDGAWSIAADDYPRETGISGTNMYVSGFFNTIGGLNRKRIARAFTTGTGVVDTNWNPNLIFPVINQNSNIYMGAPMVLSPVDVYLCGSYEYIEGLSRDGFAFLTVAEAPQLIQDTLTNFFILRNPNDSAEVTHFRITAISGASLFKSDGVTPINVGDFITVAEGGAGLRFSPGGMITAVSAVNNTTNGAGSAGTSLTMISNPAPAFQFTSPTYSVREGQGSVVVTVRKFGGSSGSGAVNYATSDITATGGADYQTKTGTLTFSATDKFKNIIISIADDLQTESDEKFAVTLSNATIVLPATSTVTIKDNDGGSSDSFMATVAPTAPPASTGALTVSLQPPEANGQWRLQGELNWHDSSFVELGLVMGNYAIEFRPVDGYREPQDATVPISAGGTNSFTFFYAAVTNLEMGNLSVVIEPDEVASAADANARGQWRRQGTTNWMNSGDVIPNLNAGNYTLEFKTIPGRIAPPTQLIGVGANATYGTVATYAFTTLPGAITPVVVPFNTATSNAPYLYNGQIQTSVGFGSGFIVKQRVVLTAAHVLFDDLSFNYVTEARWFFQRYRDKLEPVPIIPRGWFVFDGYAAQRALDDSPGISTPSSQNLDAAAMYFLEDAGRGGYGGYLSSDADANEFLLSANNKFLCGYPLDGVADADKGKLFATTPTNLNFTHLYTSVFSTTNLQSFPGNSGGPLYVQTDVNQYFPAAIYLGGSGETLVRAINGEVVDLIGRAEVSGNGGGNSTGGGVTTVSPGQTAAPIGSGLLTVNLSPSNSVVRPGWRITGLDTNYFGDTLTTVALIAGGNYTVEFKPLAGYIAPASRTVSIASGAVVTIQANYVAVSQQGSPRLYAMRMGTNVIISWPTNAPGFTLQSASVLGNLNLWSNISSGIVIGTNYVVTNKISGANFYRLKQ